MKTLMIISILMFMTSCSDSESPQKVEQAHVWKEQTDMIDKAKGVEQLLQDSAEKQQLLIQKNTQ